MREALESDAALMQPLERWDAGFMGGSGVYEIIPGFAASWIAIHLVSLATERPREYRAAPATATGPAPR